MNAIKPIKAAFDCVAATNTTMARPNMNRAGVMSRLSSGRIEVSKGKKPLINSRQRMRAIR